MLLIVCFLAKRTKIDGGGCINNNAIKIIKIN